MRVVYKGCTRGVEAALTQLDLGAAILERLADLLLEQVDLRKVRHMRKQILTMSENLC